MIDISSDFLYIHKEPIDIDLSTITSRPQNDNFNYYLHHTDIHQWLNKYTNLKILVKKINHNEDNEFSFIYNDPFEFSYSCYSYDFLIYPFLNWRNVESLQREYNSNTRLYRQLRFFIDDKYTKASIICKLYKEIDTNSSPKLYMNYYINKKIINNFILGKKDYKSYVFKIILNKLINNNIKSKSQKELENILEIIPFKVDTGESTDSSTDASTDKFKSNLPKLNIKLFDYQIQDIKWMDYIEQQVLDKNNTISYIYKPYTNIQLNSNSIDILTPVLNLESENSNFIYYCNELIQNNQEFNLLKGIYTYYGGNLINSVGLGKTIITLCHILKNKNNFDQYVNFNDDELCNYFYKRGCNKGNTCHKKILNNTFYCKEHSNTPFIDKRKVCYNNLENFHLYEHITQDFNTQKLNTNSNLIICPGHLSDQWTREYYNSFCDSASKYGKRVLLIITQDQFSNLTFGDILFSDMIITSYNFFNTKIIQNNNKSLDYIVKNIDKYLILENKYDLLHSRDNSIKQFSNFKFNSIILDESHEFKHSKIKYTINSLSSKFKWNITGTPFANGIDGFLDIMSYISKGDNYDMGDKHLQMIKSSSQLFRRNTRETIKNEINKNLITYTTKLLTFTEQERNIYDSYLKGNPNKNHNFLIKLCCHPEIYQETKDLIKNCKTFSEIQHALLEHNHNKMLKSSSIQTKLEHSIKSKEEYIASMTISTTQNNDIDSDAKSYLESIKNELSNDKRNLTNEKKNYDTIKKIYDYLNNFIINIKESETCPICLDDTNTDNLAITKCGHKLCWDCINEYIEEMNNRDFSVKCPKCNVPILKDDIYKYTEETEISNANNHDDELTNLIYKLKSTKIGNIIHYINTKLIENDKCIIFSQWDEILNIIGKSLTKKHVYCKGTVYQKKKAIKNFIEDPSLNIILLSSKNAASGTNLTAANKIILVEPIYGTKKYRQDIENQSIGRSNRIGQKRQIEVIRFIIKDTVEETCFDVDVEEDVDVDVDVDVGVGEDVDATERIV